MDIVEKQLIEFMYSSEHHIENVDYCNHLASELFEIIQIQHKGKFKGTKYPNKQQLHYNMAKYYVKAFQVFFSIKKIKDLMAPFKADLHTIDVSYSVQMPISENHIAYNCVVHAKHMYDTSGPLDTILLKLVDKNTFLPSLEEMDEIVAETKSVIQIIQPKLLLKNAELFLEKMEFQKIFSLV